MGFYNRLCKRWNTLDKCAFKFNEEISYRELREKVAAAACFLKQRDLSQGDVLALQLSNSAEFVYLTLGALSQGIVVLPLNPSYKEEVVYYLEDSKAKLLITSVKLDYTVGLPTCLIDSIRWKKGIEAVEVGPEQLAFLMLIRVHKHPYLQYLA